MLLPRYHITGILYYLNKTFIKYTLSIYYIMKSNHGVRSQSLVSELDYRIVRSVINKPKSVMRLVGELNVQHRSLLNHLNYLKKIRAIRIQRKKGTAIKEVSVDLTDVTFEIIKVSLLISGMSLQEAEKEIEKIKKTRVSS